MYLSPLFSHYSFQFVVPPSLLKQFFDVYVNITYDICETVDFHTQCLGRKFPLLKDGIRASPAEAALFEITRGPPDMSKVTWQKAYGAATLYLKAEFAQQKR